MGITVITWTSANAANTVTQSACSGVTPTTLSEASRMKKRAACWARAAGMASGERFRMTRPVCLRNSTARRSRSSASESGVWMRNLRAMLCAAVPAHFPNLRAVASERISSHRPTPVITSTATAM